MAVDGGCEGDLGHFAGEGGVLVCRGEDISRLAELDLGDVALVDLHLGLDRRCVGDLHQLRAGERGGRGDRDLAGLDGQRHDASGDRRTDLRLAALLAGVGELREGALQRFFGAFEVCLGQHGLVAVFVETVPVDQV